MNFINSLKLETPQLKWIARLWYEYIWWGQWMGVDIETRFYNLPRWSVTFYTVKVGLKLFTILLQLLWCWHYKIVSPHLAELRYILTADYCFATKNQITAIYCNMI